MGLLNYITATSMDGDYAQASRRHGPAMDSRPGAPGRLALVVLAAFGILVATAALQTARSADATQTSHDELVKQVLARKAELADRRELVDDLTSEVRTLETDLLDATVDGRAVEARLIEAGVTTGAEAARGPGVRIEVDDGPEQDPRAEVLDVDLQKMVNGLWLADAEGISINGQRVTTLTAVRLAGRSITVHRDSWRPVVARPPDALWCEVRDRQFRGEPDLARGGPAGAASRAHPGRPGGASVIAGLGLVLGVLLGLILQPSVPIWLQPYLPIAVVAALDAVFGALRAFLDGIFDDKVFVVSFVSNVLIAGMIVYLGDQLGVGGQLSTGVIVVLGIRIFSNVAAIRRHLFHA